MSNTEDTKSGEWASGLGCLIVCLLIGSCIYVTNRDEAQRQRKVDEMLRRRGIETREDFRQLENGLERELERLYRDPNARAKPLEQIIDEAAREGDRFDGR